MSHPTASAPDLAAITATFAVSGSFERGTAHGTGHINDSYVVTIRPATGEPERHLLQRINDRIFRNVPAVMENIRRVTAHAASRLAGTPDAARRTLTLVPARTGETWHRDASGGWWRCYRFIEGSTAHEVISTPDQAHTAALAYGAFQALLADLPGGRLHETIPDFHHTPKRFAAFRAALIADPHGHAATCAEVTAFALAREPMAGVLTDLQARGAIPERITHNDTKLSNVLLDEATGTALCVVDLDTVMPGLALHDFGDMVRSATSPVAEDECDLARVTMQLPLFRALAEGYLESAAFLNPVERAHLAFAGRLITYEQGLRFLTDHLLGDTYYKIQRPGHNLDRARNQFALLRSMEEQTDAMQQVIDRLAPA